MTETTEDTSGSTSGSKPRLSDADFAAARELYELGKAGVKELAQDFGVSRQTMSRRLKEAKAIKGSRAHEVADAEAKAQKAVVERFASQRATLIEETRMTGLAALKQTRMIGQKIVVDLVRNSRPVGDGDDDLRALGRLNRILIDNLNTSLEILQANEHVDEEDLPTLTIEDLTDEDILEHHKATGALEPDATLEDINTETD